jgi:hypothetical protein
MVRITFYIEPIAASASLKGAAAPASQAMNTLMIGNFALQLVM